ncbi:MAG: hypothetical protein OEV30_12220 [Ignavibacteria bacterium]|nr:hypothetical protein [Ignavibacteria bacterium]
MKMTFSCTGAILGLAVLAGCSSSGRIENESRSSAPPLLTSESLYGEGHRLYRAAEFDSARHYLEAALAIDSVYVPALRDLGQICYQTGLTREPGSAAHESEFRWALICYQRLESARQEDAETYNRLTEITHALGEQDLFLHYAGKQAERFPGDRQQYNLGLAYFEDGLFQEVITSQKEAVSAYGHSPYVGGFYRLLGDAYFAVDRQQTAERTYREGVAAADERIDFFSTADPEFRSGSPYKLLSESRRSMLVSLRKIYKLHGKTAELEEVDRRLEEIR